MKWSVAVISVGLEVVKGEFRLFMKQHNARQGNEPAPSTNFDASLGNASALFPVEYKKLELRNCQFKRRLKRNSYRI
jgi:hypothetical protein